ncbi:MULTISPECIES: FhaA domain-containing protein [unclassified Mycobacterium]|nr:MULTISPECIES: FhaA domain-containing protein [unclassified Mycobacterium]
MGIVQRFERKLEDVVGDAFARVFGGSIVPQEVQASLRREAADGVRSAGQGRLLAPNEYFVLLSTGDHEKAADDRDLDPDTFAEHLREYIRDQGWQTYGEVVVRFEQSPNLHTGQFRTRGVVNPDTKRDRTHGAVTTAPSTPDSQPGASMTDNPGPQQGRPGEEYGREDDRYGRPDQDPRGQQPPQGDQGYPPRQGGYEGGGYGQGQQYGQDYGRPPAGYEQGGYPPRPPQQGGYEQGGRGGYDQGGYGTPPQAPQGGGEYGRPPAPPQQGGYPAPPQQGGYGEPPRPNYGEYEQGGGYNAPQGPPPGQDYGRPPAYPQQGGYGAPPQQGGYGSPQGGYGEPEYGDYEHGGYQSSPDYGAPTGGGAGAGRTTVTLQLDDGSGRTYQLREGTNVIGRGQDAQFRLPDTGVSRRHLEVRFDGHAALLSDLNSTNGTTVNNAPVTEWQLADGDIIRLGHSEIIVRVQ